MMKRKVVESDKDWNLRKFVLPLQNKKGLNRQAFFGSAENLLNRIFIEIKRVRKNCFACETKYLPTKKYFFYGSGVGKKRSERRING